MRIAFGITLATFSLPLRVKFTHEDVHGGRVQLSNNVQLKLTLDGSS